MEYSYSVDAFAAIVLAVITLFAGVLIGRAGAGGAKEPSVLERDRLGSFKLHLIAESAAMAFAVVLLPLAMGDASYAGLDETVYLLTTYLPYIAVWTVVATAVAMKATSWELKIAEEWERKGKGPNAILKAVAAAYAAIVPLAVVGLGCDILPASFYTVLVIYLGTIGAWAQFGCLALCLGRR